MMIVREHIEKDSRTSTIVDLESGDAVVFSDVDYSNYDELNEEVTRILENKGSFADIKTILDKDEDKKNDVLARFGVTVTHDELIVKISDNETVSLPVKIGEIFKDVTNEEKLKSFVKFTQLLANNPYEHCKESLVDWIIKNPTLKILPDGRIQGYRGLKPNFTSIHAGYGIVNGVEVDDHLDNTPGNVLEFPRQLIDHNPSNRCSVGLHVGTLDYAESFGDKHVTVAFSPADVVSTVNDSAQEKIRVCKMEILEEIKNTHQYRIDIS